jgi:hypothetical protein
MIAIMTAKGPLWIAAWQVTLLTRGSDTKRTTITLVGDIDIEALASPEDLMLLINKAMSHIYQTPSYES